MTTYKRPLPIAWTDGRFSCRFRGLPCASPQVGRRHDSLIKRLRHRSSSPSSAAQTVSKSVAGERKDVYKRQVLRYMRENRGISQRRLLRALAVAGLIGNLIKTNASISGAECGCQAEIGSACAMAAAALGELFEMGVDQIEYAAEVALEHHLGLTCDPICGLVQIPCIERNAVAAMRAINAVRIANFLTATRKISFDTVVRTMYETGRDLSGRYRETAEGGLAKYYAGK